MKNKLYITSDHAGFERKQMLTEFISELGFEITDLGPDKLDEGDDYPDYALPFAQKVAKEEAKGIILCGNAEGVCIASNKVDGIRAALGYNVYAAKTSRTDDNSNVLCLPGKTLMDEEVKAIVKAWLATDFSEEERHVRRLDKLSKIEEDN